MSAEKLQSLVADFAKKQDQLVQQQREVGELLALVQESMSQPQKVKLAVYGLLNSGKSTLLNVLTNHLNEEFFKTGDHRVTTTNQYFETENMIYIDTPGLDGGAQDDVAAAVGKDQANLILFVHNAAKEMEKEEIDLLKKLKKEMGKNAKKSVIIVLSRADSIDPNDLDKVKQAITKQCNDLLQFAPDILAVSSHMFSKANKETDANRKTNFEKHSNISNLQAMISERQTSIDLTGVLKSKLTNKLNSKLTELSNLENNISAIRKKIKQSFNKPFAEALKQSSDMQAWLNNNKERKSDISDLRRI